MPVTVSAAVTRVLLAASLGLTAWVAPGCATSVTEPATSASADRAAAQTERYAEKCTATVWAPENVRIVAATHVSSSKTSGGDGVGGRSGYCKLEGVINQRTGFEGVGYGIGFMLSLPDAWSERILLQGGGGLNGSIPSPEDSVASGSRPALARGFAVVGHDSGHQGAVFDASFSHDQRAALDFAESSVRVVTETAKAMTARFYGKPIAYSYMAGCSTGGREAMLAAQRYPELFDGLIVGAPAMRTGFSNLALEAAAVAFNQAAPRDEEDLPIVAEAFPASDRALYISGLLSQCDLLDGLSDGVIENVMACRFDPGKLQCDGAKRDNCLSAAQVTALRRAFSAPRDASGRELYSAFPHDAGNSYDGPGIPGFIPTGRPGIFGPPSRALSMDLDARAAAVRSDAMQRLTDTNVWTNLNTFTGHGGKILFYHGVSDPWFSAYDTLDYWQRAEKANRQVWADTSRFYFVPGMGHCGGGDNTFDSFDLLSAVVAWVEDGKAPGSVIATRTHPTPAERPLCPYPSYPHYIGGDDSRAASYECRNPGT